MFTVRDEVKLVNTCLSTAGVQLVCVCIRACVRACGWAGGRVCPRTCRHIARRMMNG